MSILGIDFGDSRIGIAKSDPFGWTAQAVETIHWKDSMGKPAERIKELVAALGIKTIVVGLPRNMNGTYGPRAERTQSFIDLLEQRINAGREDSARIEIVTWDERLSSVAANRTMHELGVKTSKKKSIVDQIAAVHILQGYLDSRG